MNHRFKNLMVWQKAYQFVLTLYKLTDSFPSKELFGLVSQIRRAAISVPANIAEGSLGELETFLLLARDLKFITYPEFEIANQEEQSVARLLNALIRSLR